MKPSQETTSIAGQEEIVPDAYIKFLTHPKYARCLPASISGDDTDTVWSDNEFEIKCWHENTSDIIAIEDIKGAMPFANLENTEKLRFKEYLKLGAIRLRESVVAALFNAQIDITKLSTEYINPTMGLIQQRTIIIQQSVLPPSQSLIMPREKVHLTSLLAPSGALLAWLEMDESLIDE